MSKKKRRKLNSILYAQHIMSPENYTRGKVMGQGGFAQKPSSRTQSGGGGGSQTSGRQPRDTGQEDVKNQQRRGSQYSNPYSSQGKWGRWTGSMKKSTQSGGTNKKDSGRAFGVPGFKDKAKSKGTFGFEGKSESGSDREYEFDSTV